MATNKRDLKAYSRFDGTGRIVPGSTVLRRNKPKVGNWKETQAYECCNGGGGNCLYGFSVRTVEGEFDVWETFYSNCDIQNINAYTNPGDIIGCNVYVDNNSTTPMPNENYYFLQNYPPIYPNGVFVVENGVIVNVELV
jgi:hypothetical protein